jgi:acyl carrier protein
MDTQVRRIEAERAVRATLLRLSPGTQLPREVTPDTPLAALGVDSMTLVSLLVELEECLLLDLEMASSHLVRNCTYGGLLGICESRRAA